MYVSFAYVPANDKGQRKPDTITGCLRIHISHGDKALLLEEHMNYS
jgi:hypothetical protein